MKKYQYVKDLADDITQNPHLETSIKENPAETIASIADSPLQTDVWIYRMVILILGAVILIAIIGGIFLSLEGKNIPESIVSIGSVAIGALAGLLAPSPKK
jgi:hypothetical protein